MKPTKHPRREDHPVPYDRRFPAAPKLEVIHATDETVRAELIALPVVRTELGDHTVGSAGALSPEGLGEPRPAA
jgi:hypothetical protein